MRFLMTLWFQALFNGTSLAPDQFPSSITWAKHYKIQLSKAEHLACIQAATLALKDESK